jgi:dipeptidase D
MRLSEMKDPLRSRNEQDSTFDMKQLIGLTSYIEQLSKSDAETAQFAAVLQNFMDISAKPRPSKKEGDIADLLEARLIEARLKCHGEKLHVFRDDHNNILVEIEASRGVSKIPAILFQTHMDMVCVSDDPADDPAVNGVCPVVVGDWIRSSKKTTLGADNGFSCAVVLTLMEKLAAGGIPHGKIGWLITTDEEKDETGASALNFEIEGNYDYLFNLDNEDMGEVIVASTASARDFFDLPFKFERIGEDKDIWEFSISGASGGHSGDQIGKGGLNPVKGMAEFMADLRNKLNVAYQIVVFEAGQEDTDNVIPSSAKIILALEKGIGDHLAEITHKHLQKMKDDCPLESDLDFKFGKVTKTDSGFKAMEDDSGNTLVGLLQNFPHGVTGESSVNLAVVTVKKVGEWPYVRIEAMTRAETDEELAVYREAWIRNLDDAVGERLSRTKKPSSHALSGNPDDPYTNPAFLNVSRVYKGLFKKELKAVSTHASMDAGTIADKYRLPAICIGPTIVGSHTVDESLNISSARKFVSFLDALVDPSSYLPI